MFVMDTGVFYIRIRQLGSRLLSTKGRIMSTGPLGLGITLAVGTYTCLVCRNIEKRPVPAKRDDAFVQRAVSVATEKQPFCGHKTTPLLAKWPGYSWYRTNVPEIMHGRARATSGEREGEGGV